MSNAFHPHADRLERIPVDIDVMVTSVLTPAAEARLRDLTEQGALIEGTPPPKGTQFQIEYRGQTLYGVVIWAEHDRFGARFPFPLHEGPLYRELERARIQHEIQMRGEHATAPVTALPARQAHGFGRRGLN